MPRFAASFVGLALLLAAPGLAATAGAASITPHPDRAGKARGPLPGDGCFLGKGETRSPRCVYGVPDSDRHVVLFGDSHAMHYYPGLRPLLRERKWRLIVLTKAGCPPMPIVKREVDGQPTNCSIWRRSALRRIERRSPDLVIAGGSVNYRLYDKDEIALSESERQEKLEASYHEVLQRLGSTGASLVVMRDVPKAPFAVPACVAENIERPRECNFDLPEDHELNFDSRAAEAVNAMIVDMTGSICWNGRCRSVVKNRLVYRAGSHLTAPFARLLREPLDQALPAIR